MRRKNNRNRSNKGGQANPQNPNPAQPNRESKPPREPREPKAKDEKEGASPQKEGGENPTPRPPREPRENNSRSSRGESRGDNRDRRDNRDNRPPRRDNRDNRNHHRESQDPRDVYDPNTQELEPLPSSGVLQYATGDIFANDYQVKAFALDSNIEGVMNTQMGVAFRSHFPQMYHEYVQACESNPPAVKLGDVLVWKNPINGFTIFNLVIHTTKFYTLAPINNIEHAFREMRKIADRDGITSIAMPTIGGGMGNLNWDRAKRSLERSFQKWEGKLYVYVKPKGKWS